METIELIQAGLGPQWQPLFLAITYLGYEAAYIVLVSLYFWLVDPGGGRWLAMVLSLSFCGNVLLKAAFATDRPYVVNPAVATEAAQATGGGFSLPSGHAQGATTFWGGLAYLRRQPWLWGVAIAMIALMSFSRVYLGVHYPVDVIAGILFGVGFLLLGQGLRAHRLRLQPSWHVVIVAAGFLLALALPLIAKPLGVLTGFSSSPYAFNPPKSFGERLRVGAFGLVLAFALLLAAKGLASLLAAEWMEYWCYWLLALFIAQIWPRWFTLNSLRPAPKP